MGINMNNRKLAKLFIERPHLRQAYRSITAHGERCTPMFKHLAHCLFYAGKRLPYVFKGQIHIPGINYM
jgi:hypothetical protein